MINPSGVATGGFCVPKEAGYELATQILKEYPMADEHLRATAALCDQRTLMDLRDYAHSKLLLASRATPGKPEEARQWQIRYEFLRTMLHWAKATQIDAAASEARQEGRAQTSFSFSRALDLLVDGVKVRRLSWHEDTHLRHRKSSQSGGELNQPCVDIVASDTACGWRVTPYVVTQQDLLAHDWQVYDKTLWIAGLPEEYRGPDEQAGAGPRSLKQRLASILEYSIGDLIEDDDLVTRVATLMQWPRIATERQDYIDSVAKALDDLSDKVEQREDLGD